MFRYSSLAVVLACALSAAASAQTPNPVMQHYRAYQAAIEANDLAAAETAAAAALTASEVRNGDGGNTAALALNLANVQLERGRGREALPAAQRAHGLATAGGAVDPLAASLALGRAELAANASGAKRRLADAVAEAARRGEFKDEAFEAAMALGAAHLNDQDENDAERAFAAAVRLSAGDDDAHRISRATAHIAHGMALMVIEDPSTESPQIGEHIVRPPNGQPDAAFDAALELAQPLALQAAPDGALTSAQAVYARAMAWEAAQRGKLRALGWRNEPLEPRSLLIDAEPGDNLPPCPFSMRAQPRPIYPQELLRGDLIYASVAVVRVRTNARGDIVEARTVARAGRDEVADAIDRAAPHWTAVNWDESATCSRAAVLMFRVSFQLEGTL